MALLLTLSAWAGSASANAVTTDLCPAQLAAAIPQRAAAAPSGTAFAQRIAGQTAAQREAAVGDEILAGNVPAFLRWLKPVKLRHALANERMLDATLCVMPDYLAIGHDRDYLRLPMNLPTALRLAEVLGFTLPTRKMVDAIYRHADVQLRPEPMPPGPQMTTTEYFVRHNQRVAAQIGALNPPLGALIAGNKKDVVISNRLATHPGRIAIYGWHTADGEPIQPLSTVHGATYADYSHGIRLVSKTVYLDGKPRDVSQVLRDPRLAAVLSDEGPMRPLPPLTP